MEGQMLMPVNSVVTFMTAFVTPFLFACSQAQGAADSLRDQLEKAYPVTVMDQNGLKVVKPGAVLLVQKNGILANTKKSSPFANVYDDGQISVKTAFGKLSKDLPLNQPKSLAAGDKAYLVDLDIHEDSVVMVLQTCGGCNPAAADPGHKPHWASIQFRFVRGYLTATDLPHVQSEIGSLLALASIAPPAPASTYSESQQAPVQPEPQAAAGQPRLRHFDEIPPPTALPTTDPGAPTLRHNDDASQAQGPADSTRTTPPPTLYRTNEQQQAETGPKDPAPQPTPAPKSPDKTNTVPPASREIERGMTLDKVSSILGQPTHTDNRNGQLIATFGRKIVTFEKGRVVAVTTRQ